MKYVMRITKTRDGYWIVCTGRLNIFANGAVYDTEADARKIAFFAEQFVDHFVDRTLSDGHRGRIERLAGVKSVKHWRYVARPFETEAA